MERIVLAYAGGVESTVAIRWLAERPAVEVVALTLDLGQGSPLEEVRDRALAAGAVRAHVLDGRDEFARGFILPALKADAWGEGRAPLATALARLVVAKKLIEMAAIEQATAIAFGGDAEDVDRGRMNQALRMLNPCIPLVVPTRSWEMTRPQVFEYASAHGVPLPAVVERPFRADVNMWGRAVECALGGPTEASYVQTKAPADCPAEPAYVELSFERGVPVAVNGVAMPLVDLIASLAMIAGAHGVGRIDSFDPRGAGTTHMLHEAPAAVVLHAAHEELQRLVTAEKIVRQCRDMSVEYARLVSSGSWFSPTREAMDAFADHVQQRVTGAIRVKLFKGAWRIVSKRSAFSLSEEGVAVD